MREHKSEPNRLMRGKCILGMFLLLGAAVLGVINQLMFFGISLALLIALTASLCGDSLVYNLYKERDLVLPRPLDTNLLRKTCNSNFWTGKYSFFASLLLLCLAAGFGSKEVWVFYGTNLACAVMIIIIRSYEISRNKIALYEKLLGDATEETVS